MTNTSTDKEKKSEQQTSKPQEIAGFAFSSSIKIFDPNTGQVLIQKRVH